MARPRLISTTGDTERLVGQAPAIVALRAHIRQLVTFDTLDNPVAPTVLLQGETGTGKGLVARVIHESGPRAQGPFVEVNCAAIPEALLEAELFGFEPGAFTDARRSKPGLWEAASGGILFLDEIDALPLTLQSKLLTVIEAKRVRRLGAVVEHPVDVKLITATQADLQACVADSRFRADLYHRLAVVLLEVPPLRERGADIVLLAQYYLQHYVEAHRVSGKRLTLQAEAWLQQYAWPGNVRELGHLMERVVLLSPEPVIGPETLEQLCLPLSKPLATVTMKTAADADEAGEARQVQQALHRAAGNVARAARLLGMSRGAFRYRMARYGIAQPSKRGKTVVALPLQSVERPAGTTAHQDGDRVVPPGQEFPPPTPSWEPKPVAVLAVEVTWSANDQGEVVQYELWTVTSRWEQAIVDKVQGFGAILLPHAPSLVMAVFGAPLMLEQTPQRAVQAALAVRRLVMDVAEGGPYPGLRMAVHWGQVLVDIGASDPAAHLLPIGDTLARPGRLLGHAEPGEILASAEMVQLVGGWCELRARDTPRRMGQPDQVAPYTVVGLRPLGSPLEMHRQRPLSRFVGRERELAVLDDLLGRVREGRGQVVGIIGEPGVGKSRLCYEFMRMHPTQDWLILATNVDAYGQAIPYLPIIDLLKSYFQITSRDEVSARCDKVTDKLRMLGRPVESSLPALLTLLDVPVEDAAWQALDPPQRRQQLLDAIKRLLVLESQARPILLVIENLHWIDGETQALLNTLVEGLPTACLILLVSYRPEYQHGWGSKTYYTQLRLDPLPPEYARELLVSLLGDDASLAPLMQNLLQRAKGNPFFLEESVQTLVETLILVGERGAYRLGKPLQSLQVPATVQAVLAARIDRLPRQEKRLLQTAAVIGMEVPFALVQAISELSDEELCRGLAHLQATEFLYEARLFPEVEYTFKHALTREAAYATLPKERRRAFHTRIVAAVEALYQDRLGEQVEQLAYHALGGELWDKAVAYCRQAGTKALSHSAYREAVASFEQALDALHRLPASPATQVQAIDLRLDLRSALWPLGEHRRSFVYLQDAEAFAEALGDPHRLGWVSAALLANFWQVSDLDHALAAGQRALALAAALEDVGLTVFVRHYLGHVYRSLGDYRRAMDFYRKNVARLRGEPFHERFGLPGIASVTSYSALVISLAECGAFAEGKTLAEEGVRIAEACNHAFSRATAYWAMGWHLLRQGNFHRAIPMLERALDLTQMAHIGLSIPPGASLLGAAYALAGRTTEALPLLEQAVEQAGAMGFVLDHALRVIRLGEAYLLAGRIDEAGTQAQRALEFSQAHRERGHEAYALRLLGEIAGQHDPPAVEPAENHYQQALALAEELGMRPLQAHCHLGRGTLYAKISRPNQARAELSTAIELYRSMAMTFWLPQAEAALAQVV